MILGAPPVWTKSNAALLSQFLESGTGQLLLATLATGRPSLSGDTCETVALQAKYAGGYELCLTQMTQLMSPPLSDATTGVEGDYADLDRPAESNELEKHGAKTAP